MREEVVSSDVAASSTVRWGIQVLQLLFCVITVNFDNYFAPLPTVKQARPYCGGSTMVPLQFLGRKW